MALGSKPSCKAEPVMPVPAGFDYDRWLGPAPWAPYTPKRCHWNFRWIFDYSGGQVTDIGAHDIDIAHWGMGADHTGPTEVSGTGVFPREGLWNTATDFEFECTYAGGVALAVDSGRKYRSGVRFIGDDGWVHLTRSGIKTSPKELLRETIGPDEIHLAAPRGNHRQGHRRNFLDCIRTREPTITPIEVGHRSVTVAHLGNIAMLLGRKIRWDPKGERILGDPAASAMLSRSIREPWHL
jgi:predicted dehydrogenase